MTFRFESDRQMQMKLKNLIQVLHLQNSISDTKIKWGQTETNIYPEWYELSEKYTEILIRGKESDGVGGLVRERSEGEEFDSCWRWDFVQVRGPPIYRWSGGIESILSTFLLFFEGV